MQRYYWIGILRTNMCMFININKYTFSYVTFLIVKKKEGGEHVLLSQTILFSYKNFKK